MNILRSLKETFQLACPFCGQDDCLQIDLIVTFDVRADGDDEVFGDHVWDGDNRCKCPDCDFEATVEVFSTTLEEDAKTNRSFRPLITRLKKLKKAHQVTIKEVKDHQRKHPLPSGQNKPKAQDA